MHWVLCGVEVIVSKALPRRRRRRSDGTVGYNEEFQCRSMRFPAQDGRTGKLCFLTDSKKEQYSVILHWQGSLVFATAIVLCSGAH